MDHLDDRKGDYLLGIQGPAEFAPEVYEFDDAFANSQLL